MSIAGEIGGRDNAAAVVMTDGLPAYKHFGAKHTHLAVNHSAREYARTDDNHRDTSVMERLSGMVRNGSGRVPPYGLLTAGGG